MLARVCHSHHEDELRVHRFVVHSHLNELYRMLEIRNRDPVFKYVIDGCVRNRNPDSADVESCRKILLPFDQGVYVVVLRVAFANERSPDLLEHIRRVFRVQMVHNK